MKSVTDQFDPASHRAVSPHEALQTLRARAEKRRHLVTQVAEHHTPEEMQRLVQELQVYQIELEMQYEELLQAQGQVETAKHQYVDLYDFAPVGYFTLTATGLIQQLNLCGSKQLGTVRQRLVARRFALFVEPAYRGEFGQFLARVFASEGTQSYEMVLQREDGSPFYAQLEALRIAAPGKLPAAEQLCRLAVVDITARRQAADALAASEARFRKLFNESSDAVVLMKGHIYVDCNLAALRLLGASYKEQVVGHPVWSFAPERQPSKRLTIDLFRETVEEAMRTGSRRCDALMHKLSGEEVWVEAVLTPIEDEEGDPLVHILWRDVTAERRAATQLRESEARLSMALDASQTGVFTWDLNTNLLQWDARAQAAFGHSWVPGAVPLDSLLARLHPDDAPRVRAATSEALALRTPLALDFRVLWPDGTVHHLAMAGRAVSVASGKWAASSHGFIGIMRDVTAIYAAEAELQYKSLVLERLLSNMPMILSRYSSEGGFLESIGKGLGAVGLKNNELLGHNVLEDFPVLADSMRRVLQGEQLEFNSTVGPPEHPVSFLNYGFFDQQRQQAVVLSVDVTEVEQQKQQLRAEKEFTQSILENSIDGIVALDSSGHITAWNSEAVRYFGPAAEDVLGRMLLEVLPELSCEETRKVMGRVLAGEQVLVLGMDFQHRAARYDVYHVPLRQQEEIVGVLIIFRDVTERDQLAEEATQLRLRRQQEVLTAILNTQESERKRIAEALHNGLGQLLYATKLSLEGRGGVPGSPRKALALLREAIGTTRTISFELTPGILEDFGLRIALEELVKRITPSGLPVQLHFTGLDARLPAPVEIAIYRVVQELLNNVMKHAHAAEAMVHVAREQDHLEVTVEDNGCGFDAAALAAQPLAGIGLAGVRNRVALLGGVFSLNAQPGRGTIVSIELNL
jgi:PAS domain S-box-containing protein